MTKRFTFFDTLKPLKQRLFLVWLPNIDLIKNAQKNSVIAETTTELRVEALDWHPLRESNSQLTLRRGLLYPFN